jgi:predicted lipoprotein with Yx(FWY)xxD motif
MFRHFSRAIPALGLSLGLAALASGFVNVATAEETSWTTVQILEHPALGPMLANQDGAALYTFIIDAPGISNCFDQCLVQWPPFEAEGDPIGPPEIAGRLGAIERPDGIRQVTLDDMPLYTYLFDAGREFGRGDGSYSSGALWPAAVTGAVTPTVSMTRNPTLGYILTDANEMTLYTWDADQPGTSTCSGSCASTWVPTVPDGQLIVGPGLLRVLGSITRDDGSTQATYNGMPLYRYRADQPGEARGDGANGFGAQWHMAKMEILRN